MRTYILATVAVFCVTAAAMAQTAAPSRIDNHANGFDYQPTPSEVGPLERAAGLQPQSAQQRAANEDLERIDRDLMHEEGLSSSVPNMTSEQ